MGNEINQGAAGYATKMAANKTDSSLCKAVAANLLQNTST